MSAVVQMYGAGLERILGSLFAPGRRASGSPPGSPDDPLVATLLLIHDLHPVPLEQRVQAGARLGAAVHGVPRRQRRAAVARGRRRADPPAGELLGLLGIVGHARARDQAGARGGGARPRGARGRGSPRIRPGAAVAPARRSDRAPGHAGAGAARGSTSIRSASLTDGSLGGGQRGGLRPGRRERRRHLLAYRDRCASCGAALHDGLLLAGALVVPGVRAIVLPAPRRTLDGRRPHPARARAAAARARPGEGGRLAR